MIHIHEEAARCLLCENAPCTKACKKGDPARAIQAIRFDNEKNALRWLKDCSEADLLAAEKACIHYDQPLRIRELLKAVEELGYEEPDTLPDLGITFCGIPSRPSARWISKRCRHDSMRWARNSGHS